MVSFFVLGVQLRDVFFFLLPRGLLGCVGSSFLFVLCLVCSRPNLRETRTCLEGAGGVAAFRNQIYVFGGSWASGRALLGLLIHSQILKSMAWHCGLSAQRLPTPESQNKTSNPNPACVENPMGAPFGNPRQCWEGGVNVGGGRAANVKYEFEAPSNQT